MTIDLTPEELREFARLCAGGNEAEIDCDKLDSLVMRIEGDKWDIPAEQVLALALADAMEELAAARKVIRLVTWESIAGANRRNGKEPPEQRRNFPDYGYYLADPDEDTYVECPIPDEHIPTVRAAYAEEHTDGYD